jgi:chromosomal replication initiator protein
MAAPNRFKLDWVKTQFASRITALACQYWEQPTEVQFVLDPRLSAPKKPHHRAGAGPNGGAPSNNARMADPVPSVPELPASAAAAPRAEPHQHRPDLRQLRHR